jgi:hypothetical protein
MARIFEPTEELERGHAKFLRSLPAAVRVVAERFDPWTLYRMKSTKHYVSVMSFSEGLDDRVTLTVFVGGKYNAVLFERQVFGVDPTDLEPCEPPASDDPVGAVLTQQEVDDNIDGLRVMLAPDFWEYDKDGKAVRKRTH